MKKYTFAIVALFLFIGAVFATLVTIHYNNGLFFEEGSVEASLEFDDIVKIRFRKNPEGSTSPYTVMLWRDNVFRVYRYQASATEVTFRQEYADNNSLSFFQLKTSGIFEAVLSYGALYVASVGMLVYHGILLKKESKNKEI